MSELGACLDALTHATARLRDIGVETLDAAEAARAHDALRAVGDQVSVLCARLLAHVEADGRWAASGAARTFPEWVARRAGTSVGAARRQATTGRALRDKLPAARAAVSDGSIGFEHAQVLATLAATSADRCAALASDRPDRNEAFLVAQARRLGVDDFRRLVRRWGAAVDVAAHEREHAAAVAREHLNLTRRPDGVAISGFLATEGAETLLTALRAVGGVPGADDERSSEQRRAAALTDLARCVLDRGLGGAGGALVRPHLSVHVPFDTLERLADRVGASDDLRRALERADGSLGRAPELDDGTPIPPSVLERIACDCELTRVVFGPDGAPLDVGRAQRTFTGPQRRAVVARDRHCRYPGCGAPPALGEVHHVRWWIRDVGPTAVPNGILLCSYHHQVAHRRGLVIEWLPAGGWAFAERDGRAVGPGGQGRAPAELSGAPPPGGPTGAPPPGGPSGAPPPGGPSGQPRSVGAQGELALAG